MKIIFISIITLASIASMAYESLPRACDTGYSYKTPQNDLDDAIRSHDIIKVQAALQNPKVKINYDYYKDYESDCAPPIFVAIEEDQPDIFNLLVQNGADINSVMHILDNKAIYRTPLMWAAIKGKTGIAKEILNYPQVRINSFDYNQRGETALFLAIKNTNYEIASLIANRPEVDVNITASWYWNRTPLLMLIGNAFCKSSKKPCPNPKIDYNLVAILSQKSGLFINSDIPNSRPIRDAVYSKNDIVVDALLTSKEIDLFNAGKSGSSGLDEAIWVDNAFAVKKIISRPELPLGLIEKYVTSSPKVSGLHENMISPAFAALFESPALDPNAIDANGKSLLERYAGQPEYVFPILKNPKVDVNINNGGPLRAARWALQTCKSDDRCKTIGLYLSELKKLGAN